MCCSPNSSNFQTLQVKIEVSHHIQVEGGWKATKTLVFVLDDAPTESKKKIKEEKEKKGKKTRGKKEAGLTLKNMGSALDIGKAKSASSMTLAWRVRFLPLH